MLTLNLSANLSTVSKSLLPEWICSICGGNASQCLCVTQNPVALGDDKGKTDGDKDDPHNDVIARLERCLDLDIVLCGDDEEPTVKQMTPLSIPQWIAWSQGLPTI